MSIVEMFGKFSPMRMRNLPCYVWQNIWEVGREDPKRVVHALKVGLALTLVSFLYLLEPLFEGVGKNAVWAVMTVVLVFEFTIGATLSKGLNRGLGTLCAAFLAFFLEYIAQKSGSVFRAVFTGAAVFLIGFAATYLRFFPCIKKNYDYGVVIFLLTFNLIIGSSYGVENVLRIAYERLYLVVIGCVLCLLMSLLILPNWSGEDLHNSTIYKLEGLATSIEACVNEYFQDRDMKITRESSSEDPMKKGYMEVLDSKSKDESLALFASWEQRHLKHCYRFPWQQYVNLGEALRHLGYTAVALHGCLESEIQTPQLARSLFRDPCIQVAREVSRVLAELATSIRNRHHCSPNVLSDHLHDALQNLNLAFKSQPRLFLGSKNAHTTARMIAELKTHRVFDHSGESSKLKVPRPTFSKIALTSLEFSEALPFAGFASVLVEMVARLELVIEKVEELASAANYEEFLGSDDIVIEVN